MGLVDIVRLAMELEKKKSEFESRHDKDYYIKFLQEQNKILLSEYQELFLQYEELEQKLKKYEEFSLNKFHLFILAYAVKNNNAIGEVMLKSLSSKDSNYQIAMSELVDKHYMREGGVIAIYYNPSFEKEYFIIKEKLTEILKTLKTNNMI